MQSISPEDILKFLEENPEFFIKYPEQLAVSGLLEEQEFSSKILNIRNRLFEKMREDRQNLLNALEESIKTVRKNEKIEGDFDTLENLLFENIPSSQSLIKLAKATESQFNLGFVGFILCITEKKEGINELNKQVGNEPRLRYVSKEERKRFPKGNQTKLFEKIEHPEYFFPENIIKKIRSAAVVPLRDKRQFFGFFLLGSEKNGHYYEEMNTDLLEKLANSVSIAIKLMRLYEKKINPQRNTTQ